MTEADTATPGDDVRAVWRLMREMARSSQPQLDQAAVHAVGNTGKGLRIRLVLIAGRFGSPRPGVQERLLRSAAVVELLHVASLVHDDVIDGGTVRRGVPSVNARWGDRMALLTGDHLIARVASEVADLGVDAVSAHAAALTELVGGEAAEVAGHGAESLAAHLDVLRGKTAALFVHAVDLAGIVAEVDDVLREALRRYAHMFGIAYQVADDLRDLFAADVSKSADADLHNDVWTLAVLASLASDGADRGRLAALLEAGDHSDTAVVEVRQLVQELGGAAVARDTVAAHLHLARLATLDLPAGEERRALQELLHSTWESLPVLPPPGGGTRPVTDRHRADV